jgi:hypothetical protein
MKKSIGLLLLPLVLGIVVLVFVAGCKKEKDADLPTVTTGSLSVVITQITCNGEVTSDGGAGVEYRGFCYSKTNTAPTVDNDTILCGNGTGTFSGKLTGSFNTTYYIRAYATNKEGTAYGDGKAIKTLELIIP